MPYSVRPSLPHAIRFTDTRMFLVLGLVAVICGQFGETWYAVEQEVARHSASRGAEARALIDDYAHALDAPDHPAAAPEHFLSGADAGTKPVLRWCGVVQVLNERERLHVNCDGVTSAGTGEAALVDAVLATPGHVAELAEGDLVAVRHALATTTVDAPRHAVMLFDFSAASDAIREAAWSEGVLAEFLAYSLLAALAALYAVRISRPLAHLTRALAWVDADAEYRLPEIAGRGDLARLGRALTETCERLRGERRRLRDAHAHLCAERDLLAATLHAIDDGLIITDTSGVVRRLNPAAERISGHSSASGLGARIDELLPALPDVTTARLPPVPGARDGAALVIASPHSGALLSVCQQPIVGADGVHRGYITVMRQFADEPKLRLALESTGQVELRLRHADGDLRWVDASEVRRSYERVQLATEAVAMAFWEWEPQSGRLTFINEGFRRLTGHPEPGAAVNRRLWRLLGATDRQRLHAALRGLARGDCEQAVVTLRMQRADGEPVDLLLRGRVTRDASGAVERTRRVIGTLVDVSELVRAKRQAQSSEQVLRNVLDTFPDALVWMNADGIFDGANRRFLDIAGNSQRFAAVGMSHYLMPWREQTEALLAAAQDARALGETISFDAVVSTADAGPRRMRISVAPMQDGDHVLTVFHDIEDLHAARAALIREQERITLILQRTGAATWDWDVASDSVLVDERWYQQTAPDSPDMPPIACYADWLAKVHPDDRQMAEAAVAAVVSGSQRTFECEYRMRHANGGWIWINDLGSSVARGVGGRARRIVGMRLDISGRIERERPLRAIARAVTQTRQGTLLEALLTAACEMSGGSGAFVAAIDLDSGQARVTAGAGTAGALVGQAYDLHGTPCGTVLGEDCCVYNGDVDRRFPTDRALTELGVKSYAGHRLTGENGELCGIFVVFSTSAFGDAGMARTMVEILAPSAALEFRREQRAAAVRRSEQRYRAIYDTIPLMLVTIDDDGRIVDVNGAWERCSGYLREVIIGRPMLGCFTVESATRLERRLRLPAMTGEAGSRTYTLTTRRGDKLDVDCLHFTTRVADAVTHRVVVLEDITARRQSQEELRVAATAFTAHGPMLVLDQQRRVKRVNSDFCALTQVREDEVQGCDLRFLHILDQQPGFYRQFWRTVTREGCWQGELGIARRDGSRRMVWMTVTAVTDERCAQVGYVASMIDISDRVAAEHEVERLASYDVLTGLANRRFLTEHLQVAVAEARRYGTLGAVLFIDMDNFKNVNDSMGHGMGDRVLVEIAHRLRHSTRESDLVCRMGGDEFVVVLKQAGAGRGACEHAVRLAADKLMLALSRPYVVGDQEFHITPTIGISLFPDDQHGAEELLRNADAAMYRGKAAGRSTYRFHDPAMTDAISARVQGERELRAAARAGAFAVHFQPQLAGDGSVVGAEALLRWPHAERGMVAPDEFIRLAEDSDLIHDIGDWVFRRALEAYASWRVAGLTSIGHVSVNVSPRQLRAPDLVERLERVREAIGIDARHIVIELTEQSVIEDLRGTVAKMRRLREYGYRFSLDDFGIGYSSLAYLRDLPVDQLKIDRYFVRDIVHNATATALAETIITMGRHLDLVTIAEGVEDTAQARVLDTLGCRYFQGYLYCAPVSEVEFMRYCRTTGEAPGGG